jgi:hypothetical protein
MFDVSPAEQGDGCTGSAYYAFGGSSNINSSSVYVVMQKAMEVMDGGCTRRVSEEVQCTSSSVSHSSRTVLYRKEEHQ